MIAAASACLITRDEPHLATTLACLRPHVAEICLVVTGGETPDRAALDLVDKWVRDESCNDEDGLIEDFSVARTRSFELASHDAVFWVDADDTVDGLEGLAEQVAALPKGPAILSWPYEYAHDEGGRVISVQLRERLVRPAWAFRWEEPVHETLVPTQPRTHVGQTDLLRNVHHRKGRGAASTARNIRILRRRLARDPTRARTLFHLGLGLIDAGEPAEATAMLARFLESGGSPDERTIARMMLSKMAGDRHEFERAVRFGMDALGTLPWAECHFTLARVYHAMADHADSDVAEERAWQQCAHHALAGIRSPLTQTALWVNPLDRAGLIHASLSTALAHLGNPSGALNSVREALKVLPEDEGLKANSLIYEAQVEAARRQDASARIEQIEAEADKAGAGHGVRAALAQIAGHPYRGKGLSWHIVCGDAWETWNPSTIERVGAGGSEQAVMHLSRELAKLGHQVTVYTNCGRARHYDGVEWKPWRQAVADGVPDVLVAWRDAGFLELPARVKLLWVHDTEAPNLTGWRACLADKVMALSEWHRDCLLHTYGFLEPDRIVVTRNGVDLSLFDGPAPARDPHRVVYSSSPTRGLPELLGMWPEIRAEVPGATLHIFYGFDTMRAMARKNRDEPLGAFAEKTLAACEAMAAEGVTLHGRVPPAVLAREMRASGVWLYPSWTSYGRCAGQNWCETSCIAAAEAIAAGLHLVTLNSGALPETIGACGRVITADLAEPAGRASFVDHAVRTLTVRGGTDEDVAEREALRVAAKRFAWGPVAEHWEGLAKELIAGLDTKEEGA
jgi:glycosyltransferase involved in cell wall biosynthesis